MPHWKESAETSGVSLGATDLRGILVAVKDPVTRAETIEREGHSDPVT
jgi:hypothetical protein